MRAVYLILSAVVLGACGVRSMPLVRPLTAANGIAGEGLYSATYAWADAVENHGPGLENVRRAVRNAATDDEIARIWDSAYAATLPKLLANHGLIPDDCDGAIVVVHTRVHESGNAVSRFRCGR